MQFNSYSYLLILFVAVILFWHLPVHLRRGCVLILSFLFYATWNVYFVLLPMGLCVIAFFSSYNIRNDKYGGRHALWVGIGIIVLILGVFKYGSFFARISALSPTGLVCPCLR